MAISPTHARALNRLLEPLKGTSLQPADQAILAWQIATWCFLAKTGSLPADLMPDRSDWRGDRIADVFQHLQHLHNLRENGAGFVMLPNVLASVRDQTFAHLIEEAQQLAAGGFIGPALYTELLAGLSAYSHSGSYTLPQELIDLLVGLAQPDQGDSVYIPFDHALQLSLATATAGAKPYAELRTQGQLPYLANLLAGQPVTVAVGDPLRQPRYTQGDQLRKFTHSISFVPLGEKVPFEVADRDLYHRFLERTTAGHVLAVRHLLAQTESRSVILCANSLLFGAGSERTLRADLVHRSLQAVISLPPALLFGTSIPLSILVLNKGPTGADGTVLLVDGNDERFHKRDGKGRTTLQGWHELLQAALTGNDPAAFRITHDEIQANDYQLMVARYAKSEASDAVEAALRQGEVRPLEDLVEFIRPVPVIPSGSDAVDGVEVLEVGVGDLLENDFIHPPSKTVRLAALKNTLQPLDILISVKGSVGKVGLVPPSCGEPWVGGQTCLVLRLPKGDGQSAQHTAQTLFLYLRSALGKACLQRITSGAAVPLIQLRELRKLPIVLPTAEQAKNAADVFERVVQIQREIEALQTQQDALSRTCWPLQKAAASGAEASAAAEGEITAS